jgi:hypothetical protein
MDEEVPGSEDYEAGCDPVRDLTLLEQVRYWKERAKVAEQHAHWRGELTAGADDADWWKEL